MCRVGDRATSSRTMGRITRLAIEESHLEAPSGARNRPRKPSAADSAGGDCKPPTKTMGLGTGESAAVTCVHGGTWER